MLIIRASLNMHKKYLKLASKKVTKTGKYAEKSMDMPWNNQKYKFTFILLY